jgi:hypothetical protein
MLAPGLIDATVPISISNTTSYPLIVNVSLTNFSPIGSNGAIILGQTPGSVSNGLARWMSIDGVNSFSVSAGKTAVIHLLVENAAAMTPGGHYGAVVVSTTPINNGLSNQVSFAQRLVALIFADKIGGDIAQESLTAFSAQPSHGVPKTVTAAFKSTGNVYVIPHGFVTVTDSRGSLIAKGILNPTTSLIPQGTTRSFMTPLQSDTQKAAIGRLQTTLYYRLDGEDSYQTATLYSQGTKVLPRPVVYGITAAIILSVGSSVLFLHRRVKRRRFDYLV